MFLDIHFLVGSYTVPSEWSCLRYGFDSEGHVVSISTPEMV